MNFSTFSTGKNYNTATQRGYNYSIDSVISRLTIYWTDRIQGIDSVYASGNVLSAKVQTNDTWYENFDLKAGDYIVELFGRSSNDAIYCLGVRTRSGFTKVWGNPLQGDTFSIKSPGNYLASLNIEALKSLNYLEAHWKEEYMYNVRVEELPQGELLSQRYGTMYQNSLAFDDAAFLGNAANYNLSALTVIHSPEDIIGFQAQYYMNGGPCSPGFHTGAPTQTSRTDTVTFGSGELVNKVIVYSDDTVKGLVLFTSANNKYAFGKTAGTKNAVLLTCPQDFYVKGFSGGTGSTLQYLQVHLDESF